MGSYRIVQKWQLRFIPFFLIFLFACGQSGKADRKAELDYNHPSVFTTTSCSFSKVKNRIAGSWTGYRSCLTSDTAKALYRLEIKNYGDNSFRLIENKIEKDIQGAKTTVTAELVNIEGVYVFRYTLEPGNTPIIHLSYLSDKQLKLDELLFEKAGAI